MVETKVNIIQLLKQGHEPTQKDIYLANKEKCLSYLRRFPLDNQQLDDIYQDAVIALFENAKRGKLDSLKSSISTYLFSIGKFMCLKRIKKNQREILIENEKKIDQTFYADMADNYLIDSTKEKEAIKTKLTELGKKCKEILSLFYIDNLSIPEITEVMGYESKNVVMASKSRCLKQLKKLVHES